MTTLTVFAKRFLIAQFLYRFATAFSKIYISIFLWKLEHSLDLLAWFYIIQALGILLSYPLCGLIARLTSPLASFRLGIGFYALSYGLILLIQKQAIEVYGWIALIMGLAESLWSVGTHIVTMDTVDNQLRDRFSHIENQLASISFIVAPFIAGTVIFFVSGFTGYLMVFALSVVLFLASIFCSLWIPQVSYGGQSNLTSALTYRSKNWRLLLRATFVWGMVNGLIKSFLLTLIIYFIVHSEWWVGSFNTIMNLMTVIASFYYAHKVRPQNRIFYYLIAGFCLLSISCFLLWQATFTVLFVFVIILGLVSPALDIPMETVMYEVIDQATSQADKRLDFIVVREIPLGIGRIVGLLLFLWMGYFLQERFILLFSLVILSILYLICVFFMRTGDPE